MSEPASGSLDWLWGGLITIGGIFLTGIASIFGWKVKQMDEVAKENCAAIAELRTAVKLSEERKIESNRRLENIEANQKEQNRKLDKILFETACFRRSASKNPNDASSS